MPDLLSISPDLGGPFSAKIRISCAIPAGNEGMSVSQRRKNVMLTNKHLLDILGPDERTRLVSAEDLRS